MNLSSILQFFPDTEKSENALLELIESMMEQINQKKHGTTIGHKFETDYESLFTNAVFPVNIGKEREVIETISDMFAGVGVWEHPQTMMNVLPPPTNISIAAAAVAARYNENATWDYYSMCASRAEILVSGMLSELIGYDSQKSAGFFTFGGTGANLYAARIGIEKSVPRAKYEGLKETVHIYCSDVSHYSIQTAAIWSGIGLNQLKIIPSENNNIVVQNLEKELENTLHQGAKIGTIFATIGTTDAFGLDSLNDIALLRDKFQKKVSYQIHIHADAVIGWPFLVFGSKNKSDIDSEIREEVTYIHSIVKDLKLADSVGIDFHKTGWAPYLCSMLMLKDKSDLILLKKVKDNIPYLFQGNSYQPGLFTLETSRPNYGIKALVNLLLLGRQGYQLLLTHLMKQSVYFRKKIEQIDQIEILNRDNPGLVSCFRVYPYSKFDNDGIRYFEKEQQQRVSEDFTKYVNDYNKKLANFFHHESLSKGAFRISHTESYAKTEAGRRIVALKIYPMSPHTTHKDIDLLLNLIQERSKQIEMECHSESSLEDDNFCIFFKGDTLLSPTFG